MRKGAAVLILAVILASGFGLVNALVRTDGLSATVTPSPVVISSPTPLASPFINNAVIPKRLMIDKIGVDVPVEQVGLDEKSAMDIPKNPANAAWYNLGAKPGELGNAVIAAHFDNKDGSPSVFYNLKNLKKGDEIVVEGENNKQLKFIVTDSKSFPLNEFPLEEVFGKNTKARLNLITCEGVFNKTSRLYSHRLVVFSELAN